MQQTRRDVSLKRLPPSASANTTNQNINYIMAPSEVKVEIPWKDHYAVLGIPAHASASEIRQAYLGDITTNRDV